MSPPIEGRRLAAIACLLVVAGAEAASLRIGELRGRWGALLAFSGKSPDDARLGGSGFAFDRRLGPFLRGVASATPPRSTICLTFATEEGDPATYAASYFLAPRRVVGPARVREADFAARFDGRPAKGLGSAGAVPFGVLARLR